MSIFSIHENIIKAYKKYVTSFVNIKDSRIDGLVKKKLDNGELWPSPLLQFNPSFQVKQKTSEIESSILHDQAKACFEGYELYTHQVNAIEVGSKGEGFIVTSGTGSGKSLTFFASIFNDFFQNGGHNGVMALLVYPMNALVNSQRNEFQGYKENFEKSQTTSGEFPISVGVYTGQETREQKEAIIANPPTILMTNYVMLEYLMTRSQERQLKDNILKNLKYVVYDELHTFRGRQGADVGILNRRIDVAAKNEVIFIGTSATMASGDDLTLEDEKGLIAGVGDKLFGRKFSTSQIIGETLERQFDINNYSEASLKQAVLKGINETASIEEFQDHPLSAWIEDNIGVETREGILVRRKPIEIDEFYTMLSEAAAISPQEARIFFESYSNWLNNINIELQEKKARKQLLPFKLHQFIAQTGSVYATLDPRQERRITLEAGRYIHDPNSDKRRDLFPVVFSRDSGLDFLCVSLDSDGQLKPRLFESGIYTDDEQANETAGYVVFDLDENEPLWSKEDEDLLPDSYFRWNKSGKKLKKENAVRMPKRIYINADGQVTNKATDTPAWYISAPLLIDPYSGLLYSGRRSEFSKLTRLSSEARSTSTTILNREALKAIRIANLSSFEDKILTFSDNVQDTALQSGHFNDFNRVVEFRRALLQALDEQDLKGVQLGEAIFKKLGLPERSYAESPADDDSIKIGKTKNEEGFEQLLYYRALEDLAIAWKVTLPNLEQVGLLSFKYDHLDEVANSTAWNTVKGFSDLDPSARKTILYTLMDYFRTKYAITHESLNEGSLNEARKTILDRINSSWGLSDNEILLQPSKVVLEEKPEWRKTSYISAGYNSPIKRYLQTYPAISRVTTTKEEYEDFIKQVFSKLTSTLLRKSNIDTKKGKIDVYGLDLASLIWSKNTTGEIYENPIRQRRVKQKEEHHLNEYFQNLYADSRKIGGLDTSQDHTGLVPKDDRKQWEKDFVDKKIQSLFCSPTMELGIDINALSLVMMRNAPPNPANYVQRSGRAGRSGQAALVMTYCSSSSAHDQHYFKNKIDLVAGKVNPPTLNLENLDLLRTHLHAMFLALVDLDELVSADPSGKQGVVQLVDVVSYKLKSSIQDKLKLSEHQKSHLKESFLTIIRNFSEDEAWEQRTQQWINEAPAKFEESLKRWIELHRSSKERAKKVSDTLSRRDSYVDQTKFRELEREEKLLRRTLNKLEGIRNHFRDTESEFYIYRYLADEGFTPGYNFPSVPVRANLHQRSGDIKLIQRPKGVAIREFGPGNIIYHGGSKFSVKSLKKDSINESFEKAEINKDSGVILLGKRNKSKDVDPVIGEYIDNRKPLSNLLEIDMVEAKPREHISCEEEERSRFGFLINTYLEANEAKMDQSNRLIIKSGEDKMISLKYIPSATLYQVLEEYRSGAENDREVHIDPNTGEYLTKKKREEIHKEGLVGHDVIVRPYVKEVTDVLYFSPTEELGLDSKGVITLQYAIERGIALAFNMEEDEVGSELMGAQEIPNVMFYEKSEGSLGVLKQLSENPSLFKQIVQKAYELCFPEDEPEEKKSIPASYENLLSYRNQMDHEKIDRALIKDTLSTLMEATITSEASKQGDYEEHFKKLMSESDEKSNNERVFLRYLYENGLKLPDAAQVNISNIYANADFVYNPQTVVFIDGSVHDKPSVEEDDKTKRGALVAAGYTVIAWYYQDKIEDFIAAHSWCFPKIKD